MKRLLLPFTVFIIFISCSLEEDHEIKKVFREYLSETLHDPDSMEELNWRVVRFMRFKPNDSLDANSPLVIDYHTSFDTNYTPEIYLVRLEYRAKNGFGAMRKEEIFANYDKDGKYLQFDNIAYSYESESFINLKALSLMEPRRLFLRNEFFKRNEGKVTMEDFWKEYPEYD